MFTLILLLAATPPQPAQIDLQEPFKPVAPLTINGGK